MTEETKRAGVLEIIRAEPGMHAVLHDLSNDGVRFVPVVCWALVQDEDGDRAVTAMIAGDYDAYLVRADEEPDFIGLANPGDEQGCHWNDVAKDMRQEMEIDQQLVAESKKREN